MARSFLSPENTAQALLLGLFLCYTAVGVAFSAVVPLGEAPDEPAHFDYARYVALERALPVMQSRYADNATVEAFQPPLYYVLAALSAGWVSRWDVRLFQNPAFRFGSRLPAFLQGTEHRFPWQGGHLTWHVIRFLSLALGAASLWVTYRAGRLVFRSRWLAVAAVAYLALNPQFVYLNSVVTNDALATLAGGLIVLAALVLLKTPTLKAFAAAGLAVVLAALSKPTALLPLPGLLLAAGVAWRTLPSRRVRWLALALLVALPLAASGWWFLRNQQLYGDPLGLATAKAALAANYRPRPLNVGQLLNELPELVEQTFESSWGTFGWLAIPLPEGAFAVIALLHLPALIGLALGARRCSQRDPVRFVLAAAGLGVLAGFLYHARTVNDSGWHGRFLFPGSTVPALGFVAGWGTWLRGRERALAGAMVGAGGGLMAVALAGTLLPAYLPPRPVAPGERLPNPGDTRFAGGVRLVGHAFGPDDVAPGGAVQAILYWELGQEVDREYHFILSGYAADGQAIVARRESGLVGRFPLALWPQGEVFADRYGLQAARDVDQVVGGLYLQVFQGYRDAQPVPVVDDLGTPVADRVALGRVVVRSPMRSSGLAEDSLARFGDGEILLTGYELSPATLQAGGALSLTLHWQAAEAPSRSYHVFVHLLDAEGKLIVQHDGPPRLGLYPTSVWRAGERVVDPHPVPIPAGVEGVAQISLGLYAPDSLERLPVMGADGARYPERALPLTTVRVGR